MNGLNGWVTARHGHFEAMSVAPHKMEWQARSAARYL